MKFAAKMICYEGSESGGDGEGVCFRDVDEGAHAYGYVFQDLECFETCQEEPENGVEIQYADVLLHRQGGKRGEGVLYASCRRQTDAVR